MNHDDIEARFGRLEQRIAQVDAQLAVTRRALARLEATQAACAERIGAEIQAASEAIDDTRDRVEGLESRSAVATAGITHLAGRIDGQGAPALAGSCAGGGPHEPCSVPFLCGCACHVTADENGEDPGDVEAAAGLSPWILDEDGSTWRAQLPDGRTAVIERLDDADGRGSAFFLPKVHESRQDFATGPVCAGLLGAAAWCAEYAARQE